MDKVEEAGVAIQVGAIGDNVVISLNKGEHGLSASANPEEAAKLGTALIHVAMDLTKGKVALDIPEELFRRFMGATNNYPKGKISEDDEGELKLMITAIDNQVRIDFGKGVTWLSMEPDFARNLSNVLLEKAKEADGAPPTPLRVIN